MDFGGLFKDIDKGEQIFFTTNKGVSENYPVAPYLQMSGYGPSVRVCNSFVTSPWVICGCYRFE